MTGKKLEKKRLWYGEVVSGMVLGVAEIELRFGMNRRGLINLEVWGDEDVDVRVVKAPKPKLDCKD